MCEAAELLTCPNEDDVLAAFWCEQQQRAPQPVALQLRIAQQHAARDSCGAEQQQRGRRQRARDEERGEGNEAAPCRVQQAVQRVWADYYRDAAG